MKKVLPLFLFLLSSGIFAQNFNQITVDPAVVMANPAYATDVIIEQPEILISETFEEAADRNNIPHRSFSDLDNVENGYYIIMGVFSKGRNLKKTLKKLNRKGFNEAGYIENTQTGLNYVYLDYFPFGLEAVDACVSQLEGNYTDTTWILEVQNSLTIGGASLALLSVDEKGAVNAATAVNEDRSEINKEVALAPKETNNESLRDKNSGRSSKTLDKADAYFNKMWYAQAAELYEQALSKGEKYYTRDILQKAADAHYFNTDMEKANTWYTILYERYGKEMSEDNLFKYAHTLKGAGKYRRAKKLMRIYEKSTSNSADNELVSTEPTAREIALDKVLNTDQDYELKNLAINTEYSDFSPMFLDSNQVVFSSAKDSSFLNTRRYKWNNQPYLDLYVSKINEETQDLKEATKFSKNINTKYHEASVTFSPDNSTLYFTRNNYGKKLKRDNNGINHLKIYTAKKEG